jgi:hypothetical protein
VLIGADDNNTDDIPDEVWNGSIDEVVIHSRALSHDEIVESYTSSYIDHCVQRRELFDRGDANSDAGVDIADAIFTLAYLFAAGPAPSCLDAADANDDGSVDISDAVTVLVHLFGNRGALPYPFGECGIDRTGDELDCRFFPPCED